MKATYFGISELKGLLKIYERENGERRFSYIYCMEDLKTEKKISWNVGSKKKEVRLIAREIKLWNRRIESIKKAIETLREET
ncbi:MAG: hypothetical protein KAV87_54195 [Desulfobacteraceae bacterium]|nr:hypothetical protein [Desulfobacteraceae bacterium]